LRKITKKLLVESLQNAGLSPENINAYILAWNCFVTLYIPTKTGTSRQLSRPDDKVWEAIAKAYINDAWDYQNSGRFSNGCKAVFPKLLKLPVGEALICN